MLNILQSRSCIRNEAAGEEQVWQSLANTPQRYHGGLRSPPDTSRRAHLYTHAPTQHSDTLRYLLLAMSGGVYSDTDTKLLKPISRWSADYDLWRDGKGWLTPADQKRVETSGLPPPSVVVGIEADVGNRGDWNAFWARPAQICQWTIASAPHHPILVDALREIQRKTALGLQWLAERPLEIARLTAEGDLEGAAKLSNVALDAEPSEGGPLGVMEWTGPGLWTDCVLR